MQIGATQSQVHIAASISVWRSAGNASPGKAAASEDLLELNTKIDSGVAGRVLQNAPKSRLGEAIETAGLDIPVEEILFSSQDTSPEATARRIVDFSTGFFARHAAQHGGEDDSVQLEEFVALIKGAVEAGFASAEGILSGLGKVSPEVQGGIDETYELVVQGIDEFAREKSQLLERGTGGQTQEVGAL